MILIFLLLSVVTFPADGRAATKSQVIDILKQPSQGKNILIEGRFVKAVNYETLLFRDQTGHIEVLLDDDNSFPDRLVDPAYLVLLKG
ncbi:MAG: NirD/YgiW/YdeI family stress tolerance protein [Gammaproteobacteria bacterium]|nr:NirD/YgiW/YdeI family stress tolerance protein [Gammaproteobacteria bacterium]